MDFYSNVKKLVIEFYTNLRATGLDQEECIIKTIARFSMVSGGDTTRRMIIEAGK